MLTVQFEVPVMPWHLPVWHPEYFEPNDKDMEPEDDDEDMPEYGDFVSYTLDEVDVETIHELDPGVEVEAGDEYLMLVTACNELGWVDGHVFVNSPDSLWVEGVAHGDDEGEWLFVGEDVEDFDD